MKWILEICTNISLFGITKKKEPEKNSETKEISGLLKKALEAVSEDEKKAIAYLSEAIILYKELVKEKGTRYCSEIRMEIDRTTDDIINYEE